MTSFPAWLFQPRSDEVPSGDVTRRRNDADTDAVSEPRLTPPSAARDLLAEHRDEQLVGGLRSRDASALEAIVRGAFEPLVTFATHYLGTRDIAEDVVQGVLVRLWEGGERMSESTRLRAYLYSAVRNRALDVLKHERIAARFRDATRNEAEATVSAFESEPDDDRERLMLAMASLTERQREAVRLRYQAQLTVPDVASALGVSARGAERLLQRAVAVLRRAMGENEETISAG